MTMTTSSAHKCTCKEGAPSGKLVSTDNYYGPCPAHTIRDEDNFPWRREDVARGHATLQLRLACLVYTITAVMLFGTSAIYHRFYWGARMNAVLRRLDHSNIALIIAGTYTPLAVSFLPSGPATVLLAVIWSIGALLVLFRVFWLGAPRWLYTPLYVVMGCIALLYLPAFFAVNVPATVLLICGGAAYIAGAVCYATKWPRLRPATFSFHEVFHACTIVGFVCHYISIMLAMFAS